MPSGQMGRDEPGLSPDRGGESVCYEGQCRLASLLLRERGNLVAVCLEERRRFRVR